MTAETAAGTPAGKVPARKPRSKPLSRRAAGSARGDSTVSAVVAAAFAAFDGEDTPEVEVIEGRNFAPSTAVGDWVTLSGISERAKVVYGALKMHLNRQRGDKLVWPSTRSLAMIAGLSRGDKISGALAELSELGAIDITVVGRMPRRYTYTVHSDPPPGYPGPLTLTDWYARNEATIAKAKEKEKAARDARRAEKEKNQQADPVTPDSGGQAQPAPVAPDSGQHVDSDPGSHVAAKSGRELIRREPIRNEPPPTPPTTASGSPDSPQNGGGLNLEKPKPVTPATPATPATAAAWFCSTTTGAALAAKHAGWQLPTVERVFTQAAADGYTLHDIGVALLDMARGKYPSDHPTVSATRLLAIKHLWAPSAPTKPVAALNPDRCPVFGHEAGIVGKCHICKRELEAAAKGPDSIAGDPDRQLQAQLAVEGFHKLTAEGGLSTAKAVGKAAGLPQPVGRRRAGGTSRTHAARPGSL